MHLLKDFNEAWAIHHLSPNAAAMLVRRCLQGMLRHRWQTKSANLVEELKEIKEKVDAPLWDALNAIRTIGNIGAHIAEGESNIVEVTQSEARSLLGFLNLLFDDWYGEDKDRHRVLAGITTIARKKADPLFKKAA